MVTTCQLHCNTSMFEIQCFFVNSNNKRHLFAALFIDKNRFLCYHMAKGVNTQAFRKWIGDTL